MRVVRHGDTVVLVMDARSAAYLRGMTEHISRLTRWRDVMEVSTPMTIKLDAVLKEGEHRDFEL